ncbi:hypothetical protein PACTADRAFT_45975 [Pachysolen tannophilus NRRL Y-2460]|uniref:Probable guanine deaminase n=1 Tax=Pachysolen tannophilus NRRL Y-2460 TaxID=669874 RepID=A0A1E4TPJ6_PACTA|nr:hypothetical protein PACTADRAFT_45975 [Pachysolen tannophilus NRRL Y-2460]
MTQDGFFETDVKSAGLSDINFTVYCGTLAHTPKLGVLEVIPNAVVGVDQDGIIVFITPNAADDPLKAVSAYDPTLSLTQVDVINTDLQNESCFWFPGFFDTHIHAPQFSNNGIFGNSTLLDWLEKYTFPLESSFKDLSIAKEHYERVIDRTLSNGTTCASYYATIHPLASKLLAEIALKKGQRAFIGKVCMDKNSPDHYIETADECKQATLDVIDHIEKIDPEMELIAPIITPRFAGSCTSELLKWLGDLRESKNYHCQTHINETQVEIEWILKQFPDYNTYTDIYNDHNLLSNKTILGHGIHFTEYEKDLISKIGCGVAHCPTSNSSITSGEARIRWLLDAGINVGLGTDCSGGFTPSILEVSKHALLVSRHLVMGSKNEKEKLTVNECLYLATMGGANVCKLQDKAGSFEIGKKWECQLIDLDVQGSALDIFDYQRPNWKENDYVEAKSKFQNLIDKWVFNGDDRNVRKVYTNGRCVVNKEY